LIATAYNTAPPITDKALQKCQATIAKEGGAYLATRMKARRSCETKRAGGKVAACPDASAGKALVKARDKFAANIKKKCSDAQVTSLTFGGSCQQFLYLSFKRDGASNNNSIGAADSLVGCMADAHAGVADRMAAIGLPGTEASAFSFGVAAGDATDTGAIFWTRVPDAASPATLEVATDTKFTQGLQSFQGATVSNGESTVKVDVSGLSPAMQYFYRFKQGSNVSPVGRVVTAPAPNDSTRTVRLVWSGDSNAYNQPFTALDPARLLNPDAFLYIGDTIYGDDPLADGIVAQTVPEYHGKYRANRADAALRSILSATGTYVAPDDHEVRNDYAGAVTAFATRQAAGNFAFRRNFPLREDGTDAMRLYRSFRWGSGAEFFLIDDRQYRSAK
jgi:alkaline phosphatase D